MTNLFKQSDKRMAKKKKGKTRKSRPKTTLTVTGKGGAFLPQSVTTVLHYCDSGTLQATSGIIIDKRWNLNSVYSPENSGGGHQPMGHDTYAGLYNRYRVDRVDARIECHKSTENSVGVVALVANNSDVALTNPLSLVQEQQQSVWRTLSMSTAGSQTRVIIKKSYFPHIVTGVTKEKYRTDDRYSAQTGANPAEVICLHQLSADMLGALTTAYIYTIRLSYHVTWFDPLVVAQS